MSDASLYEAPKWFHALGGKRWEADGTHRMSWGELTLRKQATFSIKFYLSEEAFGLHTDLFGLSVFFRVCSAWRKPKETMDSWGFGFFLGDLYLNWGSRTWLIHMPWDMGAAIRYDLLRKDGTWVPFKTWSDYKRNDLYREEFPYRYTLRSGEVQRRCAEVTVDELEWRPLLSRKLQIPFPRKIRRSINVKFCDEVGEGSGSWKGGTMGCSYLMRRGETAYDTLRRTERERKFE